MSLGSVNVDTVDAGNLEHSLAASSIPAATLSDILELAEQCNNFPVRLIGDFLESPAQFLEALAPSLVTGKQLGFSFGDKLDATLLHRSSQRPESLPDRDAKFTVCHIFSVRCTPMIRTSSPDKENCLSQLY
ncbi:MAG: hypothetical protein ACRDRA_07515 [Pseudonocardiaceae bacterium]